MQSNDVLIVNFLIPSTVDLINFCGVHDSNLRSLERIIGIQIFPNTDGSLSLKGSSTIVFYAKKVMEKMLQLSQNMITHQDIAIIFNNIVKENILLTDIGLKGIAVSKYTKVKPYTQSQEEYINKILMYDITFGIGPAGTGKTYIAVAMALRELKLGNIKRIVLTRPVVETDEHLGFLPGTLEEKIDPYVRPLYDAIYDMLTIQESQQLIQNRQLELAPLAYMRGRTLADCFIILDEAQNTTINQMHMFLTRLGKNSKMVITGDISQIDLHKGKSGLIDALDKLQTIKDITIHRFKGTDTVRHGLVEQIIHAYQNVNQIIDNDREI